ncbi:MAG TPA: hypothetical protein PKA63_01945 [Oligoflexia bacterium]|nr:hypothetical protein [Oligoflexia bacterium]HMP47412.1 hypothetical protein [Oligoflexia bacterium]
MSNTLFFTPCEYVKCLNIKHFLTLEELCSRAGIPCKASGEWTKRRVSIKHDDYLKIESEPGDWGAVQITMSRDTREKEAKLALQILAYVLHDIVARQSISGLSWAKIPLPKGRIKSGKAMTNAERQRLFRRRMNYTI